MIGDVMKQTMTIIHQTANEIIYTIQSICRSPTIMLTTFIITIIIIWMHFMPIWSKIPGEAVVRRLVVTMVKIINLICGAYGLAPKQLLKMQSSLRQLKPLKQSSRRNRETRLQTQNEFSQNQCLKIVGARHREPHVIVLHH